MTKHKSLKSKHCNKDTDAASDACIQMKITVIKVNTRFESTGTCPVIWTLVYGFLLWTEDDSGLPIEPITITKTPKTFLQ